MNKKEGDMNNNKNNKTNIAELVKNVGLSPGSKRRRGNQVEILFLGLNGFKVLESK